MLNRTSTRFGQRCVARQTNISIVTPAGGDAIVPVNQSVTIEIEVTGRIPDK